MSTTNAAQLDREPQAQIAGRSSSETAPSSGSTLKLQAAERLAAHRALRRRSAGSSAAPQLFGEHAASVQPQSDTRATRIAAAVAERYAQSQSYRAFLAAEAERATQQARAAAEIAARNAEAVAAAQQQLLYDLESWEAQDAKPPALLTIAAAPVPVTPTPVSALTVKLYEEAVRRPRVSGVANAVPHETLGEEEREALDEEIAFRQAPVFGESMEAATPITANLIEFPRQLVAPRKARPRLAEGPLREEAELAGTSTQLRIFEVEADQIATGFETEIGAHSVPEWSPIRLAACTVTEAETPPEYAVVYPPSLSPAPFGLRVMAAMVDGVILLAGALGFVTVAAYVAGQLPGGQLAAIGLAGVLATLFLLYQLLFFTFAEATPGMSYARIGLCTLSDENPTRPAMRRRILAVLLAACPLGLGFMWAGLDENGLGWHDRISRMYQRSY